MNLTEFEITVLVIGSFLICCALFVCVTVVRDEIRDHAQHYVRIESVSINLNPSIKL
jgi:hypothetical protein